MGRKERRAPGSQETCHEVLIYFYIHATTCLGFLVRFSSRLFCLLYLYGTYRVHDEVMKFAGAEIQLDSASSLPEFVPYRTSLKNFPGVKVRSLG